MPLLVRHVLGDLLKVFALALTGLTSMMLLGFLVREGAEQGLGPAQVARLMPYLLPDALRFTVPTTILLAACICYGRMSASNEVVAIKSLGINPMVVLWPILGLGFGLSLLTVWLNDVAVSWGRNGVRRVVLQTVDDIAYSMLRTQKSYSTQRFSINVRDVEGDTLLRPTIVFKKSDGSPAMTLVAAEAELRADPERGVLGIVSRDSQITVDGMVTVRDPGEMAQEIPLEEASQTGAKRFNPSGMALWSIPQAIVEKRAEITDRERHLAARVGLQIVAGNLSELHSDAWLAQQGYLHDLWEQWHRLRTEPQRRWATGFSCLCFVMVGAPLAVRLRNYDYVTNFFICFLPILGVYYPLLAASVGSSKSGDLPPISVWTGNAVMALVGLWLTRKVIRY